MHKLFCATLTLYFQIGSKFYEWMVIQKNCDCTCKRHNKDKDGGGDKKKKKKKKKKQKEEEEEEEEENEDEDGTSKKLVLSNPFISSVYKGLVAANAIDNNPKTMAHSELSDDPYFTVSTAVVGPTWI